MKSCGTRHKECFAASSCVILEQFDNGHPTSKWLLPWAVPRLHHPLVLLCFAEHFLHSDICLVALVETSIESTDRRANYLGPRNFGCGWRNDYLFQLRSCNEVSTHLQSRADLLHVGRQPRWGLAFHRSPRNRLHSTMRMQSYRRTDEPILKGSEIALVIVFFPSWELFLDLLVCPLALLFAGFWSWKLPFQLSLFHFP